MKFDTKIALVLAPDLPVWQKLNAAAFLTSGIAAVHDVVGERYVDANGEAYLPMCGQPIVIFEAGEAAIRQAFEKACARRLAISVFTRELFSTGHDAPNRAAVARVGTADLDLVGLGLFGPRSQVDKCLKGLTLHG